MQNHKFKKVVIRKDKISSGKGLDAIIRFIGVVFTGAARKKN